VNAGRIYEDDLGVVAIEDALNAVARGLRFRGNDGDFLADERVDEGGFAGIGAANDRDETGFEGHGRFNCTPFDGEEGSRRQRGKEAGACAVATSDGRDQRFNTGSTEKEKKRGHGEVLLPE
jgi:hypothetical protein